LTLRPADAPSAPHGLKPFFLPPYSPDLKPERPDLRQAQDLLRKAAERSLDAPWKRVGLLLNCCTSAECANYLGTGGYVSV
jgi:transposase